MKNINTGTTDTAFTTPVSLEFPRAQLNFSADYRIIKQDSDEIVLSNMTSPIDRPERIRIARKETANIYNGSTIASSVHAPSKRGVNLHVQLQQTLEVTDTENPEFTVHVPVTTSVTIKTPASFIDAGEVTASLGRLLSCLFESNSNENDRLAGLLRGSLSPQDI